MSVKLFTVINIFRIIIIFYIHIYSIFILYSNFASVKIQPSGVLEQARDDLNDGDAEHNSDGDINQSC